MLREVYPSHLRRNLLPIDSVSELDFEEAHPSPADELEDRQRRQREADFLTFMEAAVELEDGNDHAADLLRLVALLRNDIQALKPVGSHNLNASYVSDQLGISANHASKLWSQFKKLCRQANTPELKTLIEEINPRWSEQSDRTEQHTAQPATSQNKSYRG
jgi:hypothetical protein